MRVGTGQTVIAFPFFLLSLSLSPKICCFFMISPIPRTRKRKGNLWEAVSFPNANLRAKEIMIIFPCQKLNQYQLPMTGKVNAMFIFCKCGSVCIYTYVFELFDGIGTDG